MTPRISRRRGFTLIELMIVIAIIGVLAAIAINAVTRYLAQSKTTEARLSVGRMSRDAGAAFEREGMSSNIVSLGSSAAGSHSLCTNSTSVPAASASIKGGKYQSAPSEWNTGTADSAGWSCIKFTMKDPQYYMYQYLSTGGSGLNSSFTAQAQGDLNGDTVLSTFRIYGQVQASGSSLAITIAPRVFEVNGEE